jgi:hypothetical protein
MKIKAIAMAAGLALASTCAFADPLGPSFGRVIPPAKVNGIVRSMGLMPTGEPMRNGPTYAVYATSRQGRPVRVIVDARFGRVLSVQRVVAVIPPGAYPARQQIEGVVPRPPGSIRETRSPALKPEKSATQASPNASVVSVGASNAQPAADLKPTGSTSRSPDFPPVQSFE